MVGIPEDEAQGCPLGYTHTCIETDRQTDSQTDRQGGKGRGREEKGREEREEGSWATLGSNNGGRNQL